MTYCDEIPPPPPPPPPTPPSPSLPPGDQYVAPRTYKNESCPVVLPTLRFGEAVASTVSGSEGKLEYRHDSTVKVTVLVGPYLATTGSSGCT